MHTKHRESQALKRIFTHFNITFNIYEERHAPGIGTGALVTFNQPSTIEQDQCVRGEIHFSGLMHVIAN